MKPILRRFIVASTICAALQALGIAPQFACLADSPQTSKDKVKRVIPAITLLDTRGKSHRVLDGKSKLTVIFFLGHDCPISNTYAPEIDRIVREYSQKGCMAYLAYPFHDLTAAIAEKHRTEFRHSAIGLMDPDQKLAKAVGATITPEAAVLDRAGKVVYLGRIDDRHVDFGVARPEPKRRDLRLALDEALAGKPITMPRTKAIGCFIPIKSKR
jgi:hypothetical protein